MSHPSLGVPPRDLQKGYPEGARRLEASRERLAVRALEVAIDRDPTIRDRYSEIGLRTLLRDADVFLERLGLTVAGDDPHWLAEFADHTSVPYRRRRIPLDDIIQLLEGMRAAVRAILSPEELRAADEGIDAAIERLRWHRRLAGDGRRRNPILAAIYKGG